MIDLIVNYGTLIAYAAFTIDILLEIRRIHWRKSSLDLSLSGVLIRLLAGLMLLIKLIFTNDIYLIVGQGVFSVIYAIYVFMIIWYRGSVSKTRKKPI